MTDAARTAGAQGAGGLGIPLILLAMLAFAVQDVAVKMVAADVSIWQMQAVRSAAVVLALVAFGVFGGRVWQMEPGTLGWPLARAGFMVGAYLMFYASLPMLPLSQAAAAFYIGPLLITVLAAVVMGEPIGPRRFGAVVLGFIGVVLIVRPWSTGFNVWVLLPLAAAASYAAGVIVTRWRCFDRSGLSLTLTHNLIFVAAGIAGLLVLPLLPLDAETRSAAPFVLEGWQKLGVVPLLLVLSTAASHLIGMLASISAYQGNQASRLAPFEYAYLAIIPIFDIAIWGQVPDRWTVAGMTLIAFGGSIVAWREGRSARPTARAAPRQRVDSRPD